MVRKIIYVLLFIFIYLFSGDEFNERYFSLRKARLINGIFIRLEMLVI